MKSLKKGTKVKWKFIRANLVDKRKKKLIPFKLN